ncbi:MAG: bifunctional riboflavin kinase/FAD synthetase [Lachnospiraceae bacterium]|nr:bifunctional riboflavin kinase/FAD synthetase [Lachnospiraceae bacterium]
MKIIQNKEKFILSDPTAVAIGKFDGIHVGHRRLLSEILEQKKQGLKACVFTFDPSPAVFFGVPINGELTTREEKRRLFETMGVDILVEFPMNAATAQMKPEHFVKEVLVDMLKAKFVAAGEDVSFGDKGAGNAKLLKQMEQECGYTTRLISKVCYEDREVSSTYVRECVERGDMETALTLLGSGYSIEGEVVHGHQLGRKLSMPTINLIPEEGKLLPPYGVYFAEVSIWNEQTQTWETYGGVTNIGCKPTVESEKKVGVETHIFDFDGDLYGKWVRVELLKFHRPEQQFEDVDRLKEELHKDSQICRKYLEKRHK